MYKVKRLLNSHLLVEPLEHDKVTQSGIIIPDTVEQKQHIGKVVAVGSGEYDKLKNAWTPMEIEKGDIIMFSEFAGVNIEIGRNTYKQMRQFEVIAVLEEDCGDAEGERQKETDRQLKMFEG